MSKGSSSGGYPFESAYQLRMRAMFEGGAQEGADQGPKNPELKEVDARMDRVRAKMKSHLERHAPVWIGRETNRLFQKHRAQLRPVLTPKGIMQTETSPAALAQRAMQNVEMRNANRIKKLDQIEIRLRAKLSLTHGQPRINNNNGPNI